MVNERSDEQSGHRGAKSVLLTGAFGGVGRAVLEALLEDGHRVRCLELPSRENTRLARRVGGRASVVWGDLRDPEVVTRAVEGVDVVLHVAFIIHPATERAPELAREVNVGGTRNVVRACLAQASPPRLVFASSYHVHRFDRDRAPPLRTDAPVEASDVYAAHKIEAERVVMESGLRASVLRLSSVSLDRGISPEILRTIFAIPLETRMEMIDPGDAGRAFANAVITPEIDGRVLFLGGGPRFQTTYRELYARLFPALGLRPPAEGCFAREPPFIGDWLDTAESERLLHYQRRTLDDYVERARARGVVLAATLALSPLVSWWMASHSPHRGRARGA